MEPKDIAARIAALKNLLKDLEQEPHGNDNVRTYVTVKYICDDLVKIAKERGYPWRNIESVLNSLEENAAVLAGLLPSHEVSDNDYSHYYRMELSKLSHGTCFDLGRLTSQH